MMRRRGMQVSEGVEEQDADHDAEPERQDDDHEVLGSRPSESVAKSGPRTPSTPTSEAAMPR